MTSQAERAQIFRSLHESTFVIPNPWDAGSARILASLGFRALATTSAGAANAAGVPDSKAGRDVILDNAARIVDAVDLPVAADLENGYDDPAATIRMAAEAGLVGGSIEDHDPETDSIYPIEEAVARVEAAVAAARSLDFPFTLTARCENHLYDAGDLEDTIARLLAYEAAGANVLYAPAVPDLAVVCAAVHRPVNALADGRPVGEVFAEGVTRISTGSQLHRAATTAFVAAARELSAEGTFGFLDGQLGFAEVNELLG